MISHSCDIVTFFSFPSVCPRCHKCPWLRAQFQLETRGIRYQPVLNSGSTQVPMFFSRPSEITMWINWMLPHSLASFLTQITRWQNLMLSFSGFWGFPNYLYQVLVLQTSEQHFPLTHPPTLSCSCFKFYHSYLFKNCCLCLPFSIVSFVEDLLWQTRGCLGDLGEDSLFQTLIGGFWLPCVVVKLIHI